MYKTIEDIARETCAKLISHTTSVHNVDVIAKTIEGYTHSKTLTDNTQTLYNALDRIKELEVENTKLKEEVEDIYNDNALTIAYMNGFNAGRDIVAKEILSIIRNYTKSGRLIINDNSFMMSIERLIKEPIP